jgi:hypothetical protein
VRILNLVGWVCIGLAAVAALRLHSLDSALQEFRAAAKSTSRYALVPLRWRRDLYTQEGAPTVLRLWRTFGWMIGSALLGMLLLAVAQG